MKHSRQFMVQALLMGSISILMRAVGVSFQVYVVSLVGASTAGLSSLIGGVFGFAVTLALSGIQLGCTRLIAEGLGLRDGTRIRHTLQCALAYALFFGTLSATLLFTLSTPIATHGLQQPGAAMPLRIMSLSLPAMAISSCLSGYFVAVRRVYKSTLLQVGEQLLRILVTISLFHGTAVTSPTHALSLLARADVLSSITAALLLLALFLLDRRRPDTLPDAPSPRPRKEVARHLLSVALPLAVSAYARSGLISLEHLLIPISLARYGQAQDVALASYGALQSMALPIVLFPAALPSAFANLLLPEVTESHVRGEMPRIRGIIQRVLSLALLYSIGICGVLFCFSDDLGLLLYRNAEAGHFIRLLAPLIPVMYLDSAVDAMLKGMGEQISSMRINIIDASLSVLLVWLLVPRFGVYGYLITIFCTELINAALSIRRLLHVSRVHLYPVRWVLTPLLAACSSASVCLLIQHASPTLPGNTAQKIAFVSVGIPLLFLLYLLLAYALGVHRRWELSWLLHLFARDTQPQQEKSPKANASPLDESKKAVYNKHAPLYDRNG